MLEQMCKWFSDAQGGDAEEEQHQRPLVAHAYFKTSQERSPIERLSIFLQQEILAV